MRRLFFRLSHTVNTHFVVAQSLHGTHRLAVLDVDERLQSVDDVFVVLMTRAFQWRLALMNIESFDASFQAIYCMISLSDKLCGIGKA